MPVLQRLDSAEFEGATDYSFGAIPKRVVVGPAAKALPRLPLIPGTEQYAADWIKRWHSQALAGADFGDIGCVLSADVRIIGNGHIVLGNQLLCDQRFMRSYVKNILFPKDRQVPGPGLFFVLPEVEIQRPAVLLLGHGINIYGHFLIEMLVRLFVVQRLFRVFRPADVAFVVSDDAPRWLLQILHEHFDIQTDDLISFSPGRQRLRLRKAILPEYTHTSLHASFHPETRTDYAKLRDRIVGSSGLDPIKIFISRSQFRDRSGRWQCQNESELADVAASEFGYITVAPERLSWRNQLHLFAAATHVVGEYGSALHSTLFGKHCAKVVSLGIANMVQSEIGTTMQHPQAYLGTGASGHFTIDVDAFRGVLRLCETTEGC